MNLCSIFKACTNIEPYHAFEIRQGKTRALYPFFHEIPVKFAVFAQVKHFTIYKDLVVVVLED